MLRVRARGSLLAIILALASNQVLAAADALTGVTVDVTTTADEYDASPNGTCSLREAVRTINDDADFGGCVRVTGSLSDVINIPSGTYSLTRAGIDEDANSTADLDILASVTLDGAGSVVIKGGAGYSGRIVHVLAGNVVLRDLTLRDGNLPNGRAGAGLRTEPGTTTTLTNVVVGPNTAAGNAGGILNRATMTINASTVQLNQAVGASQGGGGIFNDNDATLTINDSRVLDNTATVATEGLVNAQGGAGIFNDLGAMLTLDNTTVDGNIAQGPAGEAIIITNGGGIFSLGALDILQSTISNNISRGNAATGGGVGVMQASVLIDHSVITGNAAELDPDSFADVPEGGGIYVFSGSLALANSVVSDNTSARDAGGLVLAGSSISMENSSVSGNLAAGRGGGILVRTVLGFAPISNFANSTISGNEAGGDGGGIYFLADINANLWSMTIAANKSNADNVGGGTGGGILFESTGSGQIALRNSVLANNLEVGAGTSDDCSGVLLSSKYNLVQNTSGCSLTSGQGTDLLDVPAFLDAYADNGGPSVGASSSPIVTMFTHSPASKSPLIDGGNPDGCKDSSNAVLLTDQRGQPRPLDGPDPGLVATCDIGAVEARYPADRIFASGLE